MFFSLSRESVSGLAFCSLGHSSTVDSCTMWALDALTSMHSKIHIELYSQPLSGGSNDNESVCSAVDLVDPWVGKIPWRRERLLTPVLWPGEFQPMGLQRVPHN